MTSVSYLCKDWFLKFEKWHNLISKTPQDLEYARKYVLGLFLICKYLYLVNLTPEELSIDNEKGNILQLYNVIYLFIRNYPSNSITMDLKQLNQAYFISTCFEFHYHFLNSYGFNLLSVTSTLSISVSTFFLTDADSFMSSFTSFLLISVSPCF